MNNDYCTGGAYTLPSEVEAGVREFLKTFSPQESQLGAALILYYDEKSVAFYTLCHLTGEALAPACDFEAALDADDDEVYKLNRDIAEDQAAYKKMEEDAYYGRTFEDIVLEFDQSYRKEKPLKVYGGQHRLRAISKVSTHKGSTTHGVRVYFSLTREQKVEIATVNNTSIAVPNDLLDRMREQLLGSELRDWCQSVGLLKANQDFSDNRSPDVPTVRAARTLVVNYFAGIDAKQSELYQPIVCKSGGMDEAYLAVRKKINWSDPDLLTMGQQFTRLHTTQQNSVKNRKFDTSAEFARKALSLAIVAAWAYASGYFQRNSQLLQQHYSLPAQATAGNDPLNAKALASAKQKGVDPDNYRGLGTRFNPRELGRMLEVFIVHATHSKKITKDLANAAIQQYEAKRAHHEAEKALSSL
jgi:hypothetical protein